MKEYPKVPGSGLNTMTAVEQRRAHLSGNGYDIHHMARMELRPDQVKNNIESLFGSVELPLGLAGPLLLDHDGKSEWVYAPAGTLEGTLLASMNRGAKGVSLSGGIKAAVLHQRMVRCPMFLFKDLAEAIHFKNWIDEHFASIKRIAEQYSNHARLESVLSFVTGRAVHLKMVYTTGDAAGQNMTTTCTWHATLWIESNFAKATRISPVHFVVEGNGASDKKAAQSHLTYGRGIHVVAECELEEKVIGKVFRTSSDAFIRCFHPSVSMSHLAGMAGYNINVTNAIAAIFVATGQDLASIHESGLGVLNCERTGKGLYLSLNLPSLVIGTVGGGTHLPCQREALTLMGCTGIGGVKRLANIIAGFALALEVSTFAAVVSNQFAKAHERLGRNKPVNWLTRSEIDLDFVRQSLDYHPFQQYISEISICPAQLFDNGAIIHLSSKVNNKLIGFIPVEMVLSGQSSETILLKSKPLDKEVIKGLHLMSAAIDIELANEIARYGESTEYFRCHMKELEVYEWLHRQGYSYMPRFYGSRVEDQRELYLIAQEMLDHQAMLCIHSENEPEKWSPSLIRSVLSAINALHDLSSKVTVEEPSSDVSVFEPWLARPLYDRLINVIVREYHDKPWHRHVEKLKGYLAHLKEEHDALAQRKVLIHHDFNPRNIAIREDGSPCIYDWELVVMGFPQRDVLEFLSFVLPEDFSEEVFISLLKHSFSLQKNELDWQQWQRVCLYALKEFLVCRVTFYLVGNILLEFSFAERVFENAVRMIGILSSENLSVVPGRSSHRRSY